MKEVNTTRGLETKRCHGIESGGCKRYVADVVCSLFHTSLNSLQMIIIILYESWMKQRRCGAFLCQRIACHGRSVSDKSCSCLHSGDTHGLGTSCGSTFTKLLSIVGNCGITRRILTGEELRGRMSRLRTCLLLDMGS